MITADKKEFTNYGYKTFLIDRYRAEERVQVHFDGDAKYMIDILRSCLPCDTTEQISAFIGNLKVGEPMDTGSAKFTLLAVHNRFGNPGPSGYSDLKCVIREEGTGHLSTFRVIHTNFSCSTQLQAADSLSAMLALTACDQLGDEETCFAVVCDNFHRADKESMILVSGFPDFATAKFYARNRCCDLMNQLSKQCHTTDELFQAWIMFGEEIVAATSGDDTSLYSTTEEIISHLTESPLQEFKEWQELESKLDLQKRPFNMHSWNKD